MRMHSTVVLLLLVLSSSFMSDANASDRYLEKRIKPVQYSQPLARDLWNDTDAWKKALTPLLIEQFGADQAGIASLFLRHKHQPKEGPWVIRFGQSIAGVPVVNARLNLVLSPEGKAVVWSGQWAAKGSDWPPLWRAQLSAPAAIAKAMAAEWHLPVSAKDFVIDTALMRQKGEDAPGQYEWYYAPDFADEHWSLDRDIRTSRAWKIDTNGQLIAVWRLEISVRHDRQLETREFLVDADNGQIVARQNLTRSAAFSYRVYAENTGTHWPLAGPQGDAYFPHPTGAPDGTSLTFGSANLVNLARGPITTSDDWLSASATTTDGNNIQAYADLVQPSGLDLASGDHMANTTAPLTFDWPFQFGLNPANSLSNRNAAITHAFYVTNFLHDWLYNFGFDEAAGNGQMNNYGRGGVGGDPVRVETQDFEDRNNANMNTPGDGLPATMQIFLWDGKVTASASITSPGNLAASYTVGHAAFGPKDFDVTAEWALYDDGTVAPGEPDATTHDACEDPTPANAAQLVGKIAVIDRGVCFFVDKINRAQAAGAVGAVIINNKPDGVITMGAGDNPPTITIASLMMSQSDGSPIKDALTQGQVVTGRLQRTTDVDIDAALDTSLIAHEYGHFLNNRLVTFPETQSGGIDEGLSDFLALMFLVKPEDEANIDGAFPVSAFATSAPDGAYFGIRRQPYSTDMRINDLTFKHIEDGVALPGTAPTAGGLDGSNNSEVHATGEIWANMLWEGFVGLVKDPRYDLLTARDRMMQYHVAALMAMPNNPTFTEARDAYLAAAGAVDATDRQILLNGFAKRGLGLGAQAPDRFATGNAGVVESFDNGVTTAPSADAGADQRVTAGDTVTLDGSASSDPDGTIVGYQWVQTAGPTVVLNNANQSVATFVAPEVNTTTTLWFELTVTDNDGQTGSDLVKVNVEPIVTTPTPTGGGGGGGSVGWLWLFSLLARRRRR